MTSASGVPGPRLRVLLLAPYPLGRAPCQRYRFEQYLEPLAREGIEIVARPLIDDRAYTLLHARGHVARKTAAVMRGLVRRLEDVARARDYDLAFVHREAFPLGPAFVERLLASLGVPYVFDFDDAIYLPNVSESNRFVGPLKAASKTRRIVERAALVIAGNEHLAAWARRSNERVRVIPTTIDTDGYRPRPRPAPPRVRVGWTGSPTTTHYLRTLGGVLASLQRSHGIRLRVIGDPRFSLPDAEVEALAWRRETEVEDLGELDIGVMPLTDDEWSRAKCGAKALQYMGLGIPTVMSPVGVNREIADGGAALLAASEDEWHAALVRLIEDPGLRDEVGRRGRARVVERYSVQANMPHYVSALHAAAQR